MRIRLRQLARAFTLLEIMIAMSMLAIIVVAIYSCWSTIIKGSKVALDAAASAQRARISIQTLHDSLLCACMFTQNARYYGFIGDETGGNSELSFVAHLPGNFLRHGKFGHLNIRRLSYTVESASDGTKQLVLRQAPLLMEPDQDEINFPLVLAKDVTKFSVEYFNPTTGDWDKEWDNTNQLPVAILVSLELGHSEQDPNQPKEQMWTAVTPPGQAIPLAWQMPGQLPNSLPQQPQTNQPPSSTTPVTSNPMTPTMTPGGSSGGTVFGFGAPQQ